MYFFFNYYSRRVYCMIDSFRLIIIIIFYFFPLLLK